MKYIETFIMYIGRVNSDLASHSVYNTDKYNPIVSHSYAPPTAISRTYGDTSQQRNHGLAFAMSQSMMELSANFPIRRFVPMYYQNIQTVKGAVANCCNCSVRHSVVFLAGHPQFPFQRLPLDFRRMGYLDVLSQSNTNAVGLQGQTQ